VTDVDPGVIEQRIRIRASPETVWRYWTDPERMREWWGAAADLDPRPGGACTVRMGPPGAEPGTPVMSGEFVELVPYERIVFTFGWEPDGSAPQVAPGSTLVEVTLSAEGDDTVLVLRHSGLPVALRGDHRAGWGHHLPALIAAAAGG